MRKMLTLVALAAVFGAAPAQGVQTRGVPSCGRWTEVRRLDNRAVGYNEAWLLGYLTGIAVERNIDFLRGTDNESIDLFVDNYCREYPLHRLDAAGQALAEELIRMKGLRPK